MLNWMRQWNGSKISDFWQQWRVFLWLSVFSNNNTIEVSGKVILSTSNVVKPHGGPGSAPDPAGGPYSVPQTHSWSGGAGCPLPKNPTLTVLYSELWLCIRKLLDLIIVDWRWTDCEDVAEARSRLKRYRRPSWSVAAFHLKSAPVALNIAQILQTAFFTICRLPMTDAAINRHFWLD